MIATAGSNQFLEQFFWKRRLDPEAGGSFRSVAKRNEEITRKLE